MIAPVPLQGGVQTIQQSIYLTHGSPCGFNPWLETRVGDTELTYNDMANVLQEGINKTNNIQALKTLQTAVAAINDDPSEDNVLIYLEAFYNYGLTVWETTFKDFQIDGYTTAFSCYEANGTTIFDSKPTSNPELDDEFYPPIYRSGGVLRYSEVTLITPQPFTFNPATYNCTQEPRSPYATFPIPTLPPYPPGIPPNPYCALTLVNVRFYGILQTPAYWPYIWQRNNLDNGFNQRLLYNSSYLINQTALPESVMAISSLLVDTANTRYFARPRFGFSTRSYADGNESYNVCLVMFLTDKTNSFSLFQNLQDIFFVRLSLIKTTTPG